MVHALHEVHRVLAPGGVLIDARPDSRVAAYIERRRARRFQIFGSLRTNNVALVMDRASDHAIARVVREGLFRRKRRGRFWHSAPFESLPDLRQYLREHLRFVHRPTWVVDDVMRRRYANDQFVIRRAVRFELFEPRAKPSLLPRG